MVFFPLECAYECACGGSIFGFALVMSYRPSSPAVAAASAGGYIVFGSCACWPESWVAVYCGKETHCDILEALLAFGWKARVTDSPLGDLATDMLLPKLQECV